MHRHGFPILLSLAALAIVPFGAAAAEWPEELAAEIAVAEGCIVAFLSKMQEREMEGRQMVLAKVHCEDQRVFDAWRDDPLLPFEFRDCSGERRAC